MKLLSRYILMVATLYVSSTSLALGASLLITSSGGGSYTVQGENMNGVAGIDLTIGYDAVSLSSPSVSWGSLVSGALTVANTKVPGSIKIAIIRTEAFSGSGPIAAVTFSSRSGTGGITSLYAKLIDSRGGELPVIASIAPGAVGTSDTGSSGFISTAGVPFSQPAAPGAAASSASTSGPPVAAGLGTVTMPGDNQAKNEVRTPDAKPANPPEITEPAESKAMPTPAPAGDTVAETPEPAEVKETVYVSILERFRAFQGEKTPENLMAMFSKPISPFMHQEPGIVISDGKTTVRVAADISAIRGASANFALSGAKLVSLKKGEDSATWVLEALPQVNSVKATVTVINSSTVIEFPLTVVPPAAAVSAKQSDFASFLKDSGAKAPKYDMNGDGRHDYVDDYIYTAYFLNTTSVAARTAR